MLTADDSIQDRLIFVRGHLVLLHTDLARLYGVTPERLLAPAQYLPGEFCFPLEPSEIVKLDDDQWDQSKSFHAFSEHGALLAAFQVNTPESIALGIQVARAFIHFRDPRATDAFY